MIGLNLDDLFEVWQGLLDVVHEYAAETTASVFLEQLHKSLLAVDAKHWLEFVLVATDHLDLGVADQGLFRKTCIEGLEHLSNCCN